MKKGNTTKFRLNPKKPPKTDWGAFDAMSEQLIATAPRCRTRTRRRRPRHSLPARAACRACARCAQKLNLTQEEFAARFHLPLGTVRDWEQGAHRPDKAAQVLLTVIAKDPDAVARALEV